MKQRPQEQTQGHVRLLKCLLEPDNSRAYWQHVDAPVRAQAQRAFVEYWFGARSLPRVQLLLANFRVRFDAFPFALAVLQRWEAMSPDARRLICHWHVQLADPLYRAFAGVYLAERRAGHRPEITRDLVTKWITEHGPAQWTLATRLSFATKLLCTAHAAGLIATNRDPRPLVYPRVPADALEYVLYLLRGVDFAGTLLDNPYLRSVGLEGNVLADRIRGLRAVKLQRQGDLVSFQWHYADLSEWADHTVAGNREAAAGGGG